MNKLFLYNTLSRKKEEFKPIKKGEVGLYTCGPTVYDYAHIGNLRAYIFADILARVLKYNYGANKLKWVMNITDVDDKTIRNSKLKYPENDPMEALKRFTSKYEKIFWEDLKKINIEIPNIISHAASKKYIFGMQKMVVDIYKKGYAYIKDGSVYFNVHKYAKKHQYGQLVNLDLSNLKTGTRIDLDEYEKDNVQDFVLWKGKKESEPFWDFEIADEKLPGRPGWHIECSAMGGLELGMPFDIHTGGEDLKFPHHEDEIAQNTIAFNMEKPINFWMHNGMLMVEGKKMSKSLGNFYNLRDIENKCSDHLAFRYLCLMTHYRKPLNFSWESLRAAQEGLEHLKNQVQNLSPLTFNKDGVVPYTTVSGSVDQRFENKFLSSINDDLNIPQAMAVVFELLKSDLSKWDIKVTFDNFNRVLGLKFNDTTDYSTKDINKIEEIAKKRFSAKEENNFEESDRLREEIEKLGYVVEDTKEGMRVFKK